MFRLLSIRKYRIFCVDGKQPRNLQILGFHQATMDGVKLDEVNLDGVHLDRIDTYAVLEW